MDGVNMKKLNNWDEIMDFLSHDLCCDIVDQFHDGNDLFGAIIQQFGKFYGDLYVLSKCYENDVIAYINDFSDWNQTYDDVIMLLHFGNKYCIILRDYEIVWDWDECNIIDYFTK